MKRGRYAKSRQKACEYCVRAKTRCKPTLNGCARCAERGFACAIPQKGAINESRLKLNEDQSLERRLDLQRTGSFSLDKPEVTEVSNQPELKSFPVEPPNIDTDIELICTINAKEIRNRWLNAFAPEPDQVTKEYPKHVVSFIHRMLKSYTATVARGSDLPPFLHPHEAKSPTISRCLTLVQTCTRLTGGNTSLLAEVLESEINKTYGPKDIPNLRAEFQANLIYMMTLYFCYELNADAKTLFRRGIVNLQELACVSSETGVVCRAERDGSRPSWESWVAAETQRRSIYIMYLFDNLLSAKDGLQVFLGTELHGLPCSSAKDLWYACTRQEWETLYDAHLRARTIPSISIDELWPAVDETSVSGIADRHKRIDRWLETVDEFGTMLYAVGCCTHGG